MSDQDIREIDLEHVPTRLTTSQVTWLASLAVAAFFIGGALTTRVTPAIAVIVVLLLGYCGWVVFALQQEINDLTMYAAGEAAVAVGQSFQEELEDLDALAVAFIDAGAELLTEVERGTVSIQHFDKLHNLLVAIGAGDLP